jgi:hypothetical protein
MPAAGSGQFCLGPGTYYFYVEHVEGGLCYIDQVSFRPVDNPVEERSWGAIKAFYR